MTGRKNHTITLRAAKPTKESTSPRLKYNWLWKWFISRIHHMVSRIFCNNEFTNFSQNEFVFLHFVEKICRFVDTRLVKLSDIWNNKIVNENLQFFVCLIEDLKPRKIASENNWPLLVMDMQLNSNLMFFLPTWLTWVQNSKYNWAWPVKSQKCHCLSQR